VGALAMPSRFGHLADVTSPVGEPARDRPFKATDGRTADVRQDIASLLDRTALADRYGDIRVEVESPELFARMRFNRLGRLTQSLAPCLRKVRLGDYLSQIEAGTSDEYLSQWALPMELDRELVRVSKSGGTYTGGGSPHVYIGPANSVTPLHFDYCDSIIEQIEGAKHWSFVAPKALARRHRSPRTSQIPHFSRILDVDALARLETEEHVAMQRVEAHGGDSVFVPAGWWHFVENRLISVSLHRFAPTQAQRRRAKRMAPIRAILGQRFLSESIAWDA
jgi:hypothetical protein